jgi:hypothetical protein
VNFGGSRGNKIVCTANMSGLAVSAANGGGIGITNPIKKSQPRQYFG